jgi:hypothetical protein
MTFVAKIQKVCAMVSRHTRMISSGSHCTAHKTCLWGICRITLIALNEVNENLLFCQ